MSPLLSRTRHRAERLQFFETQKAEFPLSESAVAHLEETVATPEIKPPVEEFDEIGQDPVRHPLRPGCR